MEECECEAVIERDEEKSFVKTMLKFREFCMLFFARIFLPKSKFQVQHSLISCHNTCKSRKTINEIFFWRIKSKAIPTRSELHGKLIVWVSEAGKCWSNLCRWQPYASRLFIVVTLRNLMWNAEQRNVKRESGGKREKKHTRAREGKSVKVQKRIFFDVREHEKSRE